MFQELVPWSPLIWLCGSMCDEFLPLTLFAASKLASHYTPSILILGRFIWTSGRTCHKTGVKSHTPPLVVIATCLRITSRALQEEETKRSRLVLRNKRNKDFGSDFKNLTSRISLFTGQAGLPQSAKARCGIRAKSRRNFKLF